MSKPNFAAAKKPPVLTAEQEKYIDKGRGKDNPAKATGELVRINFLIPPNTRARFKAACAVARVDMTEELLAFVERRTAELEAQGR